MQKHLTGRTPCFFSARLPRKRLTFFVSVIAAIMAVDHVDGMDGGDGIAVAVRESAARKVISEESGIRSSTKTFQLGDKIDLSVFERIIRQEDKWGPKQPPDLSRNFLQRAELSGPHVVQENGTISFPFLGQLSVAGLTSNQLEVVISEAFEQFFHRPAFVTVVSIEHSPIYIVGPVKNPGSYKYESGMTVLHAIALAGGMQHLQPETWLDVEAIREQTRNGQTIAHIARTLARAAVLRGERSGKVVVPARFVQLVGNAAAEAAIEDEKALRGLVISTRQARETTLRAAAAEARSELQAAEGRLGPLEESIRLRNERLKAISSLNSAGIVSKAQLIEVKTSLLDMEGKKQDAMMSVIGARRKVELADAELTQFRLEYQTQLELDIAAADRETEDQLSNIVGGEASLEAIKARHETNAIEKPSPSFEILRRTVHGPETISAEEVTELSPGDLVRIAVPQLHHIEKHEAVKEVTPADHRSDGTKNSAINSISD